MRRQIKVNSTIAKYPSNNHWTPDCKMHQDSRLSRCNWHFSPPDSTHEFYVASCFACTCKIRMVALALAHAIGYSGPMESSPSLSTKLCSPFVCNISTLLFQLHSKLLCSNYTKLVLIFLLKKCRGVNTVHVQMYLFSPMNYVCIH